MCGSYALDGASRVMVVAPYLLWNMLFRRIGWIFPGHVTSQEDGQQPLVYKSNVLDGVVKVVLI